MSKELFLKKDINKEHDLSIIEQVIMLGDLAKLDPMQRVTYYHRVCESMGLNPYTRPFDYINLGGKLTLYAKKDATEQLRKVNKISITDLDGKMVDDLYIVTAKAKTPDGRIDQSTGAVSIGSLKGEQKANAIMKAETKAKRRVTLSISGMGWTDESEIDSIPNATIIDVNIETGEINEMNMNSVNSKPKKIEPLITQEPQKQIEHVKAEGYEDFTLKHFMNVDGSLSGIKYRFIQESAKKCKMSEIQVINSAIKNEKGFEDRFESWKASNYPDAKIETS